MRKFLAIGLALFAHAAILLFGGLLFFGNQEEQKKKPAIEEVDLVVAEEDAKKKEEPQVEPAEAEQQEAEALQEADQMPDLHELTTLDAAAAAPALDAMSLSALSDALSATEGAGSAGFYADSVSLGSGGRIGGEGTALEGSALDKVFSMTDLDQKPRPIYQAAPNYPFELRRRKVEGSVQLMFVVNEEGRVVDASVEKATNPEFERAAMDAVRQWKFEPAVRSGKKVPCRMRVPLRFSLG